MALSITQSTTMFAESEPEIVEIGPDLAEVEEVEPEPNQQLQCTQHAKFEDHSSYVNVKHIFGSMCLSVFICCICAGTFLSFMSNYQKKVEMIGITSLMVIILVMATTMYQQDIKTANNSGLCNYVARLPEHCRGKFKNVAIANSATIHTTI